MEILRLLNGSKLYGLDTPESDTDYVAVYVEPPHIIFSGQKAPTKQLYERSPKERTAPGQDEGVAYSVRHFLNLALKGNPTILGLLFIKDHGLISATSEGRMILENSSLFVSKMAGPKFLGYARDQLDRLQGVKTGHIPKRPWLVEKYGYDCKYASQVIRLLLQGYEFMGQGRVSSPMLKHHRNICRSVREGVFSYEDCIGLLKNWEQYLIKAVEESPLPDEPEYDKIWKLSREIHERTWRGNGKNS